MYNIQYIATLIAMLSCTSQTDAFVQSSTPAFRSRYTTKIQYTTALHPAEVPTSFEKQMRDIVKPQTKKNRAATKSTNIQEVLTLDEYKTAVVDEKESIVVVRFHAKWCRACKASTPTFHRLESQYRDANVKFVDCPMTETSSAIHKGLGIKTVPFAHIYHPTAGLVEERRMSRRHISNFGKVLQSYVKGDCSIVEGDARIDPHPKEMQRQEDDAIARSYRNSANRRNAPGAATMLL